MGESSARGNRLELESFPFVVFYRLFLRPRKGSLVSLLKKKKKKLLHRVRKPGFLPQSLGLGVPVCKMSKLGGPGPKGSSVFDALQQRFSTRDAFAPGGHHG